MSNHFQIENRPIKNINPAAYNPREIDPSAFEGLKESIKKFGMPQPLVINKRSGVLVSGHQRLKAAESLGLLTVPVVEVDLTPAEEKALNVTLNNQKISGHFTHALGDLLDEIRADLGDDFMSSIKLDDIEIPPLPEELQADENEKADSVPDVSQNECGVQLGDIYQLGSHRLMCGDSTDAQSLAKLMGNEKAGMVFADPPYGMDLDTDYSKMPSTKAEGNRVYKKVLGDGSDFSPALVKVFLDFFDYCEEVFVFGADYFSEHLPNKNRGSWFVWDKRVDPQFDKMIGSAFELCWSKSKHKREIARFNNTLFGGDVECRGRVHPTQKPTKMIEWFFERWGKSLVVDPFLGSGSTLIACEKTNRKCYGMELDPHYCSVIIKRWEQFTGGKAEKVS